MKIEVDRQGDHMFIRLGSTTVVESEEVAPNVVLDFDAQGKVVSIEILYVSETIAPGAVLAAAE